MYSAGMIRSALQHRCCRDNIDHNLLMKAVKKHTDSPWLLLYIERWLTGEIEQPDGGVTVRSKGVPQGGVISPLLSNLFMHYAFDVWMEREFRVVHGVDMPMMG